MSNVLIRINQSLISPRKTTICYSNKMHITDDMSIRFKWKNKCEGKNKSENERERERNNDCIHT